MTAKKTLFAIFYAISALFTGIAADMESNHRITIDSHFGKGFGRLIIVDGKVMVSDFVYKGRKIGIRYLLLDKDVGPDKKKLIHGIELDFATPELKLKFENLVKAEPSRTFRLTGYESIRAQGSPSHGDKGVLDEAPIDIPGWRAESVFIIHGIHSE